MSVLAQWSWTGTDSNVPTTSWSDMPTITWTADRNDLVASITGNTITLPSSVPADGYLVTWNWEFEDTSNGRVTINSRITQATGTSNLTSSRAGGYNRDNSEDRSYGNGWCVIDAPSASSTYDLEWLRDSDAPIGGLRRWSIQVTPLYYDNIGMYSGTGTTANNTHTLTKWTGLSVDYESSTAAIELSSDTVTTKTNGRRYLCFGGLASTGGAGSRTQRVGGFRKDAVAIDGAQSCIYIRQASDDVIGMSFSTIIESDGSTDLDMFFYSGGLSNTSDFSLGGAEVVGNNASSEGQMVVIELPSSAEVYTAENTAPSTAMTSTAVDLNWGGDQTGLVDAAFTYFDSTEVTVENTTDVLLGFNIRLRPTISATQRNTHYAELTVNGTVDPTIRHGNYMRNDQSTSGTFGSAVNLMGPVAATAGDELGVRIFELSGTESGGSPEANWQGGWFIDLDTLESTGPSPSSGSGTATDTQDTASGSGTSVAPTFTASGTPADTQDTASGSGTSTGPASTASGTPADAQDATADAQALGNLAPRWEDWAGPDGNSYDPLKWEDCEDSGGGASANEPTLTGDGYIEMPLDASDGIMLRSLDQFDYDQGVTFSTRWQQVTQRQTGFNVAWILSDDEVMETWSIYPNHGLYLACDTNQESISLYDAFEGANGNLLTSKTFALAGLTSTGVGTRWNWHLWTDGTDIEVTIWDVENDRPSTPTLVVDSSNPPANPQRLSHSTGKIRFGFGQNVESGLVDIGPLYANEYIPPSSTASAAVTDTQDTASGSATFVASASTASGTPSDTQDTATGVGVSVAPTFTASGTPSDTQDTATGSGTYSADRTASGTPSDTQDTATGAGYVLIPGRDSVSVSVTTPVSGVRTGSGGGTDTQDTASGAGTITATAAGTPADTQDTASGAGTITVAASGTATDTQDSAGGSSSSGTSASAAAIDTQDAASGAGAVTVIASAAITDTQDTASGAGTPIATGSGAAADTQDAASGVALSEPISTGSGVAADGQDTAGGSSSSGTSASAAVTDTQDAASGVGLSEPITTGSGSPSDQSDIAAGSGTLTSAASGSPTDIQDTASGSATSEPISVASGAAADGQDTAGGSSSSSTSASGVTLDSQDTASGAGTVTVTASGVAADSQDAASGAGTLKVSASGATSDTQDTASGVAARVSSAVGYWFGPELVANGDGSAGDNTNWSLFDYVSNDAPPGSTGSFALADIGWTTRVSDTPIAYDERKTYRFRYWIKRHDGDPDVRYYSLLYETQDNGAGGELGISANDVYRVAGSTYTTLAQDLNPGDSTVVLTDATGWADTPQAGHQRSISWWSDIDTDGRFVHIAPGGQVYPPYTITHDHLSDNTNGLYSDRVGNTLNLTNVWAGPALVAGTPVMNSSAGSGFWYGNSNKYYPSDWEFHEEFYGPGLLATDEGRPPLEGELAEHIELYRYGQVDGNVPDIDSFLTSDLGGRVRWGTEFIRPGWLANRWDTDITDLETRYGGVSLQLINVPVDSGDGASGSGTCVPPVFTATGAAEDGEDTATGAGAITVSASGTAEDGADAASGVALSEPITTGSGAAADGQDAGAGQAGTNASGSGTAADGQDAAAGVGLSEPITTGSGTAADSADTAAGAAVRVAGGTGTGQDSQDAAAGTGTLISTASGVAVDGQDTAGGSAGTDTAATGAASDTQDTASGAALAFPPAIGAGAVTDSQDSALAVGTFTSSATGTPSDQNDIASGAATITTNSAGTASDQSDSGTGAGTVTVTASGTSVDGQDAAGGSSSSSTSAIGGGQDTQDLASGTASAPRQATAAVSDTQDDASGSAEVLNPRVATGAPSDTQDTASGAGLRPSTASGAASDGSDTATGVATPIFTAVGSGQDQSDLAAGAGIFISRASGSATDTEDGAAGAGTFISSADGSPVDGSDSAVGTGTYFSPPSTASGAASDGQDTIEAEALLGLINLTGVPLSVRRVDAARYVRRIDPERVVSRVDAERMVSREDPERTVNREDDVRYVSRIG